MVKPAEPPPITTTLWSRDAELKFRSVDEKYRFVVVDSEEAKTEGAAATLAAHLMPPRIILKGENEGGREVK